MKIRNLTENEESRCIYFLTTKRTKGRETLLPPKSFVHFVFFVVKILNIYETFGLRLRSGRRINIDRVLFECAFFNR